MGLKCECVLSGENGGCNNGGGGSGGGIQIVTPVFLGASTGIVSSNGGVGQFPQFCLCHFCV